MLTWKVFHQRLYNALIEQKTGGWRNNPNHAPLWLQEKKRKERKREGGEQDEKTTTHKICINSTRNDDLVTRIYSNIPAPTTLVYRSRIYSNINPYTRLIGASTSRKVLIVNCY